MFLGSGPRLTASSGTGAALSLDLRAASLDSRLTLARASGATDLINGLVAAFATDAPRVSALNGLLVEDARTNIARYSETLDNTPWTFNFDNASRTTATVTNPMGTSATTALLTENSSAGAHGWRPSITISASTAYTFSVFVKAKERSYVRLSFYSSGTPNLTGDADFNLNTGTITAAGSFTPTITACANGWFRLSITGTTGAGATSLECKIVLGNNSGVFSYTGDGTSSLYVWGAQLEAGAFMTSYIPTTTASVTRAVENCTLAAGSWPARTTQRAAYAYKNNDMAGAVAGGTVATDTSSPDDMPSGMTTLRLGSALSSGAFNGYVRQARYWRQRLSNEQMKAMTT